MHTIYNKTIASLRTIGVVAMLLAVSPALAQKKGDVNADSRRSIADVTCLVRDLFTHTETSPWSDVDGDGRPTVADLRLAAEMVLGLVQGYSFVDLGLPSGRLWATEDMPGFYAWGETSPKTLFGWHNYRHSANGSSVLMEKYSTQENYWGGDSETPDGLISLQPEDDAATQEWGTQWILPTETDWRELFTNCSRQWVTRNGQAGLLLTGRNGNTLFFATSGFYMGSSLMNGTSRAYYWMPKILDTRPTSGYCAVLSASGLEVATSIRYCGLRLRAVVIQ